MNTVLQSVDSSTVKAAHALSRRRFLHRAAGVGFAAFAGITAWGTVFTGISGADGTCSSPCGPSPICYGGNCSSGQCASYSTNRPWNQFVCDNGANCWNEPYCYSCPNRGRWSCCDCCSVNYHAGAKVCASCGSTGRWACVCRTKTSSC